MLVGLLVLIIVVSPVLAATVTTDKKDYVPEEVVTITGTGFTAEKAVYITVERPDKSTSQSVEEDQVYTDASGNFIATYQLDGIAGTYKIYAMDSEGVNGYAEFTDCVFPPIPEFPSLALPLGMMVGLMGCVYFIKSREKQI